MGIDSIMWHIDEGLTGLVGQWNSYTTTFVTLLLGILTYSLFTRADPDTHPMLLARQAQPAPVRQEGESAVYRSHASPHGMPLNTGLNVKDPGASKWSRGRDGDVRDVWRQAVAGTPETEGQIKGKGRLLTVHGSEKVIEHNLDDITRQINLIGSHILDQGGNRVAVYLPNSVELVAALFACAFHNLTAIILPFNKSEEAVLSMLRRSAADTVVALPGSFPFDAVVKNYPALRNVVWVADDGTRHMDWNEVPKGTGGAVNVSTWHDIVAEQPVDAGRDLPAVEGQKEARDVTIFWQSKPGEMEEMVRFTSANLVAAVAGQMLAIPTSQRLGPSDLFLPADSLANTHTLILTLAALFSNSSVAFNSAAGGAEDLTLATRGISPTVLAATPAALLRTHAQASASVTKSALARTVHGIQSRSLTQSGVMPVASLISSLNDGLRPALGHTPGKLRLVFVAERVGASTPPLSSTVLSDLRVFTGARVVYALTAPKVAGAVTQTEFYDYRVVEDPSAVSRASHFGSPLTTTEVLLRDKGEHKTTDDKIEGEIVVRGPCVAGAEASLGVVGKIRDDNTLAYI
ncbi:hypothetical protein RB598_002196 [Gaeumannomyces tritici]